MLKGRRFVAALLCAAIVVLGVAVTSASTQPSAAAPREVKLALFPSLDYAPLFVGLKLGIWKKHGLDLKITYVYTGAGLFAFSTMDDIVQALAAIDAEYDRHSRAAAGIAREYFGHDVVLTRLLEDVGL